MPVGFPVVDGYDRYDTFDEYARSAANNWTPMVKTMRVGTHVGPRLTPMVPRS